MEQKLAPAKKIAEIYLPYLPLFASLAVIRRLEWIKVAPQKADEPKPVLMWILAMKGNSSTCFTMFPLTILYWVLQQTPSSFSLHSRFFSFERSSSHSEEKDGKLSSFVCSDLNSGQFSLRLHRHPSLHSPGKKSE